MNAKPLDLADAASASRAATWQIVVPGLLLAAGCLFLYLAGFTRYDLFTDDEIRYAEAGRQMLISGNWVVPEYNGESRYQKPILFYWLQAGAQGFFGPSSWAARLPTALAGVAVVLIIAGLGRALWGGTAGCWSGVVFAVSMSPMLLSRLAFTDVVLLLFMHGAMTCFILARLPDFAGRRRRLYRTMYVCLALGVLTKGPVALALPTAVVVPWLALRGELRQTLGEARCLEGVAILAVLAGPWYAAAHFYTGGEFTRHFLLQENLGRFASVINQHHQPAYFHLLLLVPLTFPWTGLLPAVIGSAMRHRLRNIDLPTSIVWLFLWHIMLVLVMCTISRTRVWTYTLPIFPPLALLSGRWIAACLSESSMRRLPIGWLLWPFAVCAAAAAFAMWLVGWQDLPPPVQEVLSYVHDPRLFTALRWTATLLAVLGSIWILLHYLARPRLELAGLAGGAAGLYLFFWCVSVPAFDRVWNDPVRALGSHARQQPQAVVATYFVHELGLNFHGDLRRVEHFRENSLDSLRRLLESDRPVLVLVDHRRRDDLADLNFQSWGESPRFLYGANFPKP